MDAPLARLSLVVPTLNEAAGIEACLAALAPLRARGHEVIVADGGSTDATARLAAPLADRVLQAPRGRAAQMNAGAAAATGAALLFLHADTFLPPQADQLVLQALATRAWGRFDVTIDSEDPRLAVIAYFMNRRSRLSGIATGDQAIFVRRADFSGFPPIALMEDVAFSRAMRRVSPPACLAARVRTSARRWEKRGVARTVLLMWRLRFAYWRGGDPDELARHYAD
jgi:rSAM/selenodomain-associated transferase 2